MIRLIIKHALWLTLVSGSNCQEAKFLRFKNFDSEKIEMLTFGNLTGPSEIGLLKIGDTLQGIIRSSAIDIKKTNAVYKELNTKGILEMVNSNFTKTGGLKSDYFNELFFLGKERYSNHLETFHFALVFKGNLNPEYSTVKKKTVFMITMEDKSVRSIVCLFYKFKNSDMSWEEHTTRIDEDEFHYFTKTLRTDVFDSTTAIIELKNSYRLNDKGKIEDLTEIEF